MRDPRAQPTPSNDAALHGNPEAIILDGRALRPDMRKNIGDEWWGNLEDWDSKARNGVLLDYNWLVL